MATNNNNNPMQYSGFNQFPTYGQQSFAQFFPQPQGSVYMINNSNEISTVPVGTNGVSAAICLSEMVLYLKAMQNGGPMLLRYKLNSMDTPITQTPQNNPISSQQNNYIQDNERLLNILKNYDDRIKSLEAMLQGRNTNNSDNVNDNSISQSLDNENGGGNKKWEI